MKKEFNIGDIFYAAWNNIYNSPSIFKIEVLDIKGRTVTLKRTCLGITHLFSDYQKVNSNTPNLMLCEFDEKPERILKTTLGQLAKGKFRETGVSYSETFYMFSKLVTKNGHTWIVK